MAKISKPIPTPNLVLISDPNSDVDDLLSFVLAARLADENKINLKGVITTNGAQNIRFRRAKIAKASFMELGYEFLKVCFGADYDEEYYQPANFLAENGYTKNIEEKGSVIDNKAQLLLQNAISASKNKQLIILINAQMSDALKFIEKLKEEKLKKIKRVVIMGDVLPTKDKDGFYLPDPNSYNNASSISSATELYKMLQQKNISTTFVNKNCAYQTSVDKSFFEDIQKINHPLSKAIAFGQKEGLKKLYQDTKDNKYSHFDIKRFSKVFLGNEDLLNGTQDFDFVWDNIKNFNLYDVVSLVACIDNEFKKYGDFQRYCPEKKFFYATIKEPNALREYIKEKIIKKLSNQPD